MDELTPDEEKLADTWDKLWNVDVGLRYLVRILIESATLDQARSRLREWLDDYDPDEREDSEQA